jgi:hypothetical protein
MSSRMRQQRAFQTNTPDDTAQSMQKLERATADAISDVDARKADKYTVRPVYNAAVFNCAVWDFVIADDGCYIYLPTPTADMAGETVMVVATGGTVQVLPTAGKLRGASLVSLSSRAPTQFVCDGVAWW